MAVVNPSAQQDLSDPNSAVAIPVFASHGSDPANPFLSLSYLEKLVLSMRDPKRSELGLLTVIDEFSLKIANHHLRVWFLLCDMRLLKLI